MGIAQWSTTAANNASGAAPINWAEGQAPSTVNDSARQMMADVAVWYQSPEWLNYGQTPTFVSASQFTVVGNQTTIFSVGRRVRVFVTAGTAYGVISASAFTSLTTVTVTLDSGALDSGLSEVDVGILNPAFASLVQLPYLTLTTTPGLSIPATNASIDIGNPGSANTPFLQMRSAGNSGHWDVRFLASGGSASSDGQGAMTIFATGGLSCTGNITASSDERLKTDWQPMPGDFLESLASLKRGTYTRIDSGYRQVGVGAQSLQRFLPEAVQGEDYLSVAYGQAALVACAELAQEVLRLRELLEPVK